MALPSERFAVYVAFNFIFLTVVNFTARASVGGGPKVFSLLQPYDFLYYSGVRAYYGGEWGKAAELLEKSIATKESTLKTRRECHDECVAAGTEALSKLGRWRTSYSDVTPSCICRWVEINPGRVHLFFQS